MVAVSLRANYLFGYGFGQTPEKAQVFGWANVAADLWKVVRSHCHHEPVARTAEALRAEPHADLALCVCCGDLPAPLASTRKIAPHSSAAAKQLQQPTRMPSASSKKSRRSCETLTRSAAWRKSMRRSQPCLLDPSCPASACAAPSESSQRIARRRNERRQKRVSKLPPCAKNAQRPTKRARSQSRKAHCERRSRSCVKAVALSPPDPVAELFAWLSRGQLSVRDIGFGFPLVFAFLIEIVSAFGPAGIVAYAEATRRNSDVEHDTAGHGALWRACASRGEQRRAWARRQVDGGSHRTDRRYLGNHASTSCTPTTKCGVSARD